MNTTHIRCSSERGCTGTVGNVTEFESWQIQNCGHIWDDVTVADSVLSSTILPKVGVP